MRPPNPRDCLPDGVTPFERFEQKVTIFVQYLGVFGISTNTLLRRALRVLGDDFPRKMLKRGYAISHRIQGTSFVLYALSTEGRQLAELYLGRKLGSPRRLDKVSSLMLSHDLSTQATLLESLDAMAKRTGSQVDLGEFLRYARESRDLTSIDPWARPDLLYVDPHSGAAYALEYERSQKGHEELKGKLARTLRASSSYRRLTVEFAIAGGQRVADRYRRVWDEVLEEASQDGIRLEDLRVSCSFRPTKHFPGIR